MGYRGKNDNVQRIWFPTVKTDPGGVAGWKDLSTEDYNTASIYMPVFARCSLIRVIIATSYNAYVTAGDWWIAIHKRPKDGVQEEYWGPSVDTGENPGEGLWIDENYTFVFGGSQLSKRVFDFPRGQYILTPDDVFFSRLHYNANAQLGGSTGNWLIAYDLLEDK